MPNGITDHHGQALLAFLGQRDVIETVTAHGETLTPDLGGNATGQDVTRAVIAAIRTAEG